MIFLDHCRITLKLQHVTHVWTSVVSAAGYTVLWIRIIHRYSTAF